MKLSIGITVSSLIILSLLISLAVHIVPVSAATPPALYASGASPDFCGDLACPVVVDPEMMVKDGGNTFSVARVVIVGNFTTSDVLSFTNANGISGSYDSASGVLTLTSSTPLGGAAWQAVLRTVTFATSSTDKLSRTIQFTLANVLYFYGTGHYYEYIPNAQLNWTEAKAFTDNQAYYGTGAGKPTGVYGLQGYLATIASAEENAFIASKLQGFGWIGASDAGHDKIWQWETGPEAGTIFTYQNGYNPDGPEYSGFGVDTTYTNPLGMYYAWAENEPNDDNGSTQGSPGVEDYGHMYGSGAWNDFPDTSTAIQGYVVEYGGMPGDPLLHLTDSVIVNIEPIYNYAPEITQGSQTTVDMSKNGTPTTFSLALSATDGDSGDTLAWSIYTPAGYGAVSVDSGTGVVSYTPKTDFIGSDYFVAQVTDSNNGFDRITVYVNVHDTDKQSPAVSIGTVDPATGLVGQPYTVPVTVSGASGTPAGSVTVTDGYGASCTAPLTDGAGSCSLTSATAGKKTLTATYSGDGVYASGSATKVYELIRVTVSLMDFVFSANPVMYLDYFTATIQLVPTVDYGPITGTLNFSADGGQTCAVHLTTEDNGTGSCQFQAVNLGGISVTVRFTGDEYSPYYSNSTLSTSLDVYESTTTTLQASSPTTPYKSLVTFTATVASVHDTGVPTGSVQFYDDGITLGTPVTLVEGAASLTTSTLAIGDHPITAAYSGDMLNYSSATLSALTYTIEKNTTTTEITGVSPSPSVYNQPVTVTYHVTTADNGAPSGNVTVSDGVRSCTAAASVGQCSLALTNVGTRSLTATYGEDALYKSSTSAPSTQVVNQAFSETTLASTVNPSVFGQEVILAATVTSSSGAPTGSVEFFDGASSLGTATIVGDTASFTTTSLSVGSHAITAQYLSDVNFNTSTTDPGISQVVNKASTTTAITTDMAPHSVYNQAVEVHFSVVAAGLGSGSPGGNVTVSDGSVSCTGTVAAGFCPLTFTTPGTRSLTATYAGDDNFLGSPSTSVDHVVDKAAAAVSLVSSASPSVYTQPVDWTASVTSSAGTPDGNVSFYDGETFLGTTPLISGTATYHAPLLSLGGHSISAVYAESDHYLGHASTALTQVVNTASTQTTILSHVPAAIVVGQPLTVSVQVEAVSPATGIPTGEVKVTGGGDECLAELVNGAGSCPILPMVSGALAISADYLDDDYFDPSSAEPYSGPSVGAASTSTTVSASHTEFLIGRSVSFTAHVTVKGPGSGAPQGSVQFYIDGKAFGAPVALQQGEALSAATTSLGLGGHIITAAYIGSDAYLASASETVPLTVNPLVLFFPSISR